MNEDVLCLGLDSSTQSLTATVIDPAQGVIVAEESVLFDKDLSSYGTVNGVCAGEEEGEVHSPPVMWAEALDLIFSRLKDSGVPLERVQAISGSAQQHGSVYLNKRFKGVIGTLDPAQPLVEQVAGIFSRSTSPVWMDSSTQEECREIERAAGGREACIHITGSPVFKRFTGPQIRKFFKTDPEGYSETAYIQLVSSFMGSFLTGKPVCIEPGDGAGMSMMDIAEGQWSPVMLEAVAPGVGDRLPEIRQSDTSAGQINDYFVKKYGCSPSADVVLFSGDNPCSLIGTGLVAPGTAAVSLGTSDTMFCCMKELKTPEKGEGVVFGAPTGDYMPLICMRNGSLARERVRDMYGLDWTGFSECLRKTEPGNRGKIMLPWFVEEIYPSLEGVRRYGLAEDCACENVRAVVEAQAMALRIHSEWMDVPAETIYITGGAAVNPEIRQVFADVFQAEVHRFETSNSASLGAALRALFRANRSRGNMCSWQEVVEPFTRPVSGSTAVPGPSTREIYESFREQYIVYEREAIG